MGLVKILDFCSALNVKEGTVRSKISRGQIVCNEKRLIDTEDPINYKYIVEINGGDQSVFEKHCINNIANVEKKVSPTTKKTTKVVKSKEIISKVVRKKEEKQKISVSEKVNKINDSVKVVPSQNKNKICKECGDEYKLSVSNRSLKYCSENCKKAVRSKVNLNNKLSRKTKIESGDIDFIANDVFMKYKQRSPSRGLEFNLDLDFFKKHVKSDCYYCGKQIDKVGFDRKDNAIGYTVENSVPCCSECNFMKRDLSFDDFIERCKSISKNFTNEKENEAIFEKEIAKQQRQTILEIDIAQKQANLQNVQRTSEIKKMQLEKIMGNTLPLDQVMSVMAINYKAIFKSFHAQLKNISSTMVQNLGGTKDDLNAIMIELEQSLNHIKETSRENSNDDIEKLIEEYSQVRSRGERK